MRATGSAALLVFSQHVGNARAKKDPLHRLLYGRVDLLLACSDKIRSNALATCPLPGSRCRTAYAPVDLRSFRFDPRARAGWRRGWALGPRGFAVGFAARLTPGKGHDRVLEVAESLAGRSPQVRFFLAGGPSPGEEAFAESLREGIRRRGLEGRVTLVGYVDAVPGFLSALDLVLHPARAEAFGMAVVEALACKRPVLALDGEGAAEILRGRGKTVRGGCLLAEDRTEAWADAILRLGRDRGLRDRWSREARAVAGRFSLERFVGLHLEAYRSMRT
jgi:glycosyltransferase involved in cell wall biosynthesis